MKKEKIFILLSLLFISLPSVSQGTGEGCTPSLFNDHHREQVLALARENPRVTIAELAEKLDDDNISISIVTEIISELNNENRLVRVGSGRDGFYRVLEDGESPSDWEEQRKEEVFALIRDNERMTGRKLAEITGWPVDIISKVISELKQEKRITSVGGDPRYSFYHVLEDGDNPPLNWKEQKEQRKGVLVLIRENPHITKKELAEITGWLERMIHFKRSSRLN